MERADTVLIGIVAAAALLVAALIGGAISESHEKQKDNEWEAKHPCYEKRTVLKDVNRKGERIFVDLCLKRVGL